MTCILGLIHEGKVYLGADSAGSTDEIVLSRKEPKAFKIGKFGFAYTTSFRMGDILHYSFTPPPFTVGQITVDKYMRTLFIDEVQATFESGGFGSRGKDADGEAGGNFLVGFAGRLFSIQADYQVGEHRIEYFADGAGSHFAFGSLHSTADHKPKERVLMALQASAKFSPSVSAPFTIITV